MHRAHEPDCASKNFRTCTCDMEEKAHVGGVMLAEFLHLIRSTLKAK